MINLFRKIKARIVKHRILETNGVFIPQIYTGHWEGISRKDNEYYKDLWFSTDEQLARCSSKTFDEANIRLQDHLDYLENKKRQEKEIIHLMQPEPKFWRILKRKQHDS